MAFEYFSMMEEKRRLNLELCQILREEYKEHIRQKKFYGEDYVETCQPIATRFLSHEEYKRQAENLKI